MSSNPRHIAVVSQMCINIGVIVISEKNAFIDPVTFNLSTPKPHDFCDIPRSFPVPSLNTGLICF